jgi:hypothetical protein
LRKVINYPARFKKFGKLLTWFIALGGLVASATAVKSIYDATLGARDVEYHRLAKLRPLVQFESIRSILGNSEQLIKLSHKLKPSSTDSDLIGTNKAIEYLFIRKYDLVQVVTNEDDTVLFLAITIRDRAFHPKFQLGNGGDTAGYVTLGTTTFAAVQAWGPGIAGGYFGNHGQFSYAESYGGGRVTGFQAYVLGLNDAGCYSEKDLDAIAETFNPADDSGVWPYDFGESTFLQSRNADAFRAKATVNTFMITAPFVDPSWISKEFSIGPAKDYIDALGPTGEGTGRCQ